MKSFLSHLRKFFVKNTPEAALTGALLASLTGYTTGSLNAQNAVLAVIGALVAFGFAEAGKDGSENQAVTGPADNPTPVK